MTGAELVLRVDLIVKGKIITKGDRLFVQPEKLLKGPVLPLYPIGWQHGDSQGAYIKDKDKGLFLLSEYKGMYLPALPGSFNPSGKLEYIVEILDLVHHPKLFLDKQAFPPSANFIFVLGHFLSGEEKITTDGIITLSPPKSYGPLLREEGIEYLQDCLKIEDKWILKTTLTAIRKMHAYDTVPFVAPFLNHEDREIRWLTIKFLGQAQTDQAVKTLCSKLDQDAGLSSEYLTGRIVKELIKIASPKSLSSLEFAATQGVESAWYAVARLGNTQSFEPMLEAARLDPKNCSKNVETLSWLVRRSNLPTEPWMYQALDSHDKRVARIPLWRKWWNANGDNFLVVRSIDEASKLPLPE